jgi:methionyl-tRNA formyltransferase
MAVDKTSVIFFGSGPVAASSLAFVAEHFAVEAVITKSVPAHHKGAAPVEVLANSLGLPLLFASTKKELDIFLSEREFTSRIGIVIDYGVIISTSVIERFPLGIINSHFSLLPQWRGADPISFSILSGQQKTGVSLMVIDAGLDTGKLITQKTIEIAPTDTTPVLTERLITLSNELIADYLPRYIAGDITPHNQPHPDRATFSRKLTKEDGILDWSKPAHVLECEVRAYTGWPKSRTTFGAHMIIVTKAHIETEQKTPLDILCQDGAFLSIDELIAPSGKTMTADAFLRGYAAG